ncbi:amino-acid N-acetyltransferase [Pelagicoccus sp. SDUM812003]|uniref:amino-acid N-acetyltransferase n=1 Tax=Pelagicoccus sp. SDUM812003 TaxID=3041267 RepID=UPI00280CB0B5|nr:amino-acid N-acetyltransferase [Pelagicoccus sp. SDUM812003]MDQ8205571.1 amino-acid N-acetyltransferase [Pelagicoccus sp. SDUM812003]
MDASEPQQTIKPADLRGILNYVPRFLGQTFVVALDGAIIEHENLPNVLLDIAVLRSLQINVVIVHGIGKQLRDLSSQRNIEATDFTGSGPTDIKTLDLAIRASSRVSHQILEALTKAGLKCAITNSVKAKPAGVLKGVDHLYTGKADQIDADFLNHLISKNIIPIIQPIGFDRNGHTLRVDSDALAVDTAIALSATKLLYLTEQNGFTQDGQLTQQIPVAELERMLSSEAFQTNHAPLLSKSRNALRGVKANISRIHILDGRIHDGLIREVFSNEGVGTLIYGNEYQQIRKATRDETALLYHLTRSGVAKDELIFRSMQTIETKIDNFYVYEVDGNIMACVLLDTMEGDPTMREISSLFVHPLYQRRGIGHKLVRFACHRAEEEGAKRVIAFSTQSHAFFKGVSGFEETTPDVLPPARRAAYEANQRKSKILLKQVGA